LLLAQVGLVEPEQQKEATDLIPVLLVLLLLAVAVVVRKLLPQHLVVQVAADLISKLQVVLEPLVKETLVVIRNILALHTQVRVVEGLEQ
jgi:hypothetical protein